MLGTFAQATSDFTYTYNTTNTEDVTKILGLGIAAFFITFLVIYLISALVLSFVFKKANRPMWAAYVPIYSSWVLFEMAGKPGWWALLNFIPFVGSVIAFVLWIVASLELAKRFAKGPVFAILGLILFPIIGFLILAFGKAPYTPLGAEGQNAFGAPTPPADTMNTFAAPPIAPEQPIADQQPVEPIAAAPVSPEFGSVGDNPVQPQQPPLPPQDISVEPQSPPENEDENQPFPPTPPTPPTNPVV